TRSGQIESTSVGNNPFAPNQNFDMAVEGMASDSAAPQTEEMFFDEDLIEQISRAEVAIIKTGSMQLQVDDPKTSLDAAEDIATGLGGSVENRYVYESDDGRQIDANAQLKIPSDVFDK